MKLTSVRVVLTAAIVALGCATPKAKEPSEQPRKDVAADEAPAAAPVKTEVPAAEPAHTQPASAEPVKTEPVKTEPVKTEPVKTEPVKTEPVKTEPVKTEPVKTEPVKTEPVKAQPVKVEPVKTGGAGKYTLVAVAAPDKKIERLWKSKCGSCHGLDGKGATEKGKKMKVADMSAATWQTARSNDELKKVILEGYKKEVAGVLKEMDGYKDELSADQLDGLVQYCRWVGAPK